MRKVGHMLSDAVGRAEVIRAARAKTILRDWVSIVGEGIAKRSRPDKFDHGTVWVAVEGSAWAQELRMSKDRILERLRERAGEPTLFIDVRFGVRPVPPLPMELDEDERLVEDFSELSIREIAEKRLEKWPTSEG